jgi:hypothetical protein
MELTFIRIIQFILITVVLMSTSVSADDAEVDVTVNAPEYVSDDFEVTIDITNVSDLNGAQFDLVYDPDVIDVLDVESGNIDDIEIPISTWVHKDDDRIRVMIWKFDVVDVGGLCGSGYLAKITFEIIGDTGDTSAIYISDEFTRKLSEAKGADDIPANWFGDTVTVGSLSSTSISAPTPTVDVTSTPAQAATSIQSTQSGSLPIPKVVKKEIPDTEVPGISQGGNESDILEMLRASNFIAIYAFIGLLAVYYIISLIH